MHKIIFVYDPSLSRENSQFTVRLQSAHKEGNRWEVENFLKIYSTRDLQQVAADVPDRRLFKDAIENEMTLRNAEARFHSNETDYTCLRIQSSRLYSFVAGCQEKEILIHPDGSLTDFEISKNILPELFVESNRFDIRLLGKSITESEYIVKTPPVTAVYGSCVIQLNENISYAFLKAMPIHKDLSEGLRESLLSEYALHPEKISIVTQKQKEEKNLPRDEIKPVLKFNDSLRKAQLIFFYDGLAVKETDSRTVIYDPATDIKIHRNLEDENRFREILLANGFFLRPRDSLNWFLSAKSLEAVLPILENAGFTIMVKNRRLAPAVPVMWKIFSDKNHICAKSLWVSGNYGETTDAMFAAYRNNRLFYEKKDGSYGLISNEIRRLLSNLSQHGMFIRDTLRFNRADFSYVCSLFEKVEKIDADPSFSELLAFVRHFDGIRRYEVPVSLAPVLRSYQMLGFNWLRTLKHLGLNGILADDMGLGKTLQVLALLKSLKAENKRLNPVLLVVPKTLIFNWELEIKKFTPDLSYSVYAGPRKTGNPEIPKDGHILLTSYGRVRTEIEFFCGIRWGYVILDEANAIKNPDAAITGSIKKIPSIHRLAITGTPVENSPSDLWSLFDFLMPGFLYDLKRFKSRYGEGRGALAELQVKTRPYILRRLKRDVLKELPRKTEISIYCEFTGDQKIAYDQALLSARNELNGISGKPVFVLSLLLKLRQIACHPELALKDAEKTYTSGKTETVFHMAEKILSAGHKILIFSQFTSHLKIVRKVLGQSGRTTFYLDGQTKDRKDVIDRFKSYGRACAFFISLKTGGTGLNLHEANYVFLLDPWWNPAVENQAIDRCHRIGQKLPVTVYRFITRGSIEEKVAELKHVKKQMEETLIREFVPDYTPPDESGMRDLILSD